MIVLAWMILMGKELMKKLLQIFVNLFKMRHSKKNQTVISSVYLAVCNVLWCLKVVESRRVLLKSWANWCKHLLFLIKRANILDLLFIFFSLILANLKMNKIREINILMMMKLKKKKKILRLKLQVMMIKNWLLKIW